MRGFSGLVPGNHTWPTWGRPPWGKLLGTKSSSSQPCRVHVKSLCITGKTRALFISFGSKPVLPLSFRSRTTFCQVKWSVYRHGKKNLKRRPKFLFPLSTLNAFHYGRLLRLSARNLTYEGKLVKIKQNQSHPF